MLTTIDDLFTSLENSGFQTENGSLGERVEFLIIKDLLYDVLLDRVPSHYVEQYQLQQNHLSNDRRLYFHFGGAESAQHNLKI